MQYSALTMAFASTALAQVYGSLTAAPIAPSAPVYGAPPVLSAAPVMPAPFPSSNLTALPIFPSGNGTGLPVPLPVQTSDLTTYTTVCPITTCYTNGGIPTTTVVTVTSTITTCVKCAGVPVPAATTPGAVPPVASAPAPSAGSSQGVPAVPGAAPAGTGSNGGIPKVSGTVPASQFTGAAVAIKPVGALMAGAAAAVALL